MTVTADASGTGRRRSAVLWGVVGALFFLVLHQGYLLLDGTFLGVAPVAGVAAAVFAVTALVSYYTAGHHEALEPDEVTATEGTSPAEPSETGDATADEGDDEWIWGGPSSDGPGDGATEPRDGSE